MPLEIQPLDDRGDAWNSFAKQSEDAWFWHTTHWMEYTQEYSADRFIANSSFTIVENETILAICPLVTERDVLEERGNKFSYSGGPIPFPATRNDLSPAKKQQVLNLYVQTLTSIAQRTDVGYVSVRVPSVAKSYMAFGAPFASPMLRYGYIDLAHLTQVIDLREEASVLWGNIRKGHKADIKRAEQSCEVTVWDGGSITTEKFQEYQSLHAKDAGKVTRSQTTFDLMRAWVEDGNAILVEAQHAGQTAAFSLVILFNSGAYYGSSCKDPDLVGIPASHLIQWRTISWLKEHGIDWYDVGVQQFSPQWFDPAGAKDISIADFKRGFGGATVPLVTAEFFYDKALLKRTFESRLDGYLSSLHTTPN